MMRFNSKIGLLLVLYSMGLCARESRLSKPDERRIAFGVRQAAARYQTMQQPQQNIENLNPDELTIADYAGQHSKALEHNTSTGVLTTNGKAAYVQLRSAMLSGLQADFNAIARAPGAVRKLVSPQAALAFSMMGRDSSLMVGHAPFSVTSAKGSANLLEVYWKAICRDVYFNEYGTGVGTDADGSGGSLTSKASLVLNDFGVDFDGPRSGGQVTPSVLFRGNYSGCLVGPYVSQFLLASLHRVFQAQIAEKQLLPIAQKREFGVSHADFESLQNGLIPKSYNANDFDPVNLRYPVTGRDLATYVHMDGLYEAYYNAANVLLFNGFPLSPVLPYLSGSITNEVPFASMGVPDIQASLAAVADEAIKAAWANKWRAWRLLRPEEFAGLVHQYKVTGLNPYNIHSSMTALHAGIDTLQIVYNRNATQSLASIDPLQLLTLSEAQTYYLPQIYPEGCPIHPTYPSGHATVAGACITVIKAFFDDQALISTYMTPVKPNPADFTQLVALSGEGELVMTVGGELDKVAANIAMGRNFAGIHYRDDADYGMELGERIAICWLQDKARTYAEEGFTGFELTKLNGQRIRITADNVQIL